MSQEAAPLDSSLVWAAEQRQIGFRRLVWLIVFAAFAIWVVLATELAIRGVAMFARFLHGAWRHVEV